jgi:hypothetical protein
MVAIEKEGIKRRVTAAKAFLLYMTKRAALLDGLRIAAIESLRADAAAPSRV